jgi:predicted ArsR family transcriptional regulator
VEALDSPVLHWRTNMPTTTTKSQTKSDTVIALLDRAKGATLDEICKATNWQPHSARAFLTGLRKKGFELAREQRGEEGTSYRITARSSAEDASV